MMGPFPKKNSMTAGCEFPSFSEIFRTAILGSFYTLINTRSSRQNTVVMKNLWPADSVLQCYHKRLPPSTIITKTFFQV